MRGHQARGARSSGQGCAVIRPGVRGHQARGARSSGQGCAVIRPGVRGHQARGARSSGQGCVVIRPGVRWSSGQGCVVIRPGVRGHQARGARSSGQGCVVIRPGVRGPHAMGPLATGNAPGRRPRRRRPSCTGCDEPGGVHVVDEVVVLDHQLELLREVRHAHEGERVARVRPLGAVRASTCRSGRPASTSA